MRMHRITGSGARLDGEAGFTLVEAMVAISDARPSGCSPIAQAMTFGLRSTGLARQKLGGPRRDRSADGASARAQLRQPRAVGRDPIPHETDPPNPDYWVDSPTRPSTPTARGRWRPRRSSGSPARTPRSSTTRRPSSRADTTYAVYMYVTWVDNEDDGTGDADAATVTRQRREADDASRSRGRTRLTGELARPSQLSRAVLRRVGAVPGRPGLLQPGPDASYARPTHEQRPELLVHGRRGRHRRLDLRGLVGDRGLRRRRTAGTYYGSGSTFAVNLDEEGPTACITSVVRRRRRVRRTTRC